ENAAENARKCIETNYYGTKRMIEAMIPLMKPSAAGARIVNVSSRLARINGKRNRIENEELREKLCDEESLSEEMIDETINSFLQQVEDGSWKTGGWPQTFTDYSVSKLAVNTYTRYMARKLSERPEGYAGSVTVEQGADTGVWIALVPDQA
ncbi:(+)-neomenthol dehydrogenase-like, partial [Trifolium medium]|nr:(+)-neomenthol dehydrogenase-like [Trifolium medium]